MDLECLLLLLMLCLGLLWLIRFLGNDGIFFFVELEFSLRFIDWERLEILDDFGFLRLFLERLSVVRLVFVYRFGKGLVRLIFLMIYFCW